MKRAVVLLLIGAIQADTHQGLGLNALQSCSLPVLTSFSMATQAINPPGASHSRPSISQAASLGITRFGREGAMSPWIKKSDVSKRSVDEAIAMVSPHIPFAVNWVPRSEYIEQLRHAAKVLVNQKVKRVLVVGSGLFDLPLVLGVLGIDVVFIDKAKGRVKQMNKLTKVLNTNLVIPPQYVQANIDGVHEMDSPLFAKNSFDAVLLLSLSGPMTGIAPGFEGDVEHAVDNALSLVKNGGLVFASNTPIQRPQGQVTLGDIILARSPMTVRETSIPEIKTPFDALDESHYPQQYLPVTNLVYRIRKPRPLADKNNGASGISEFAHSLREQLGIQFQEGDRKIFLPWLFRVREDLASFDTILRVTTHSALRWVAVQYMLKHYPQASPYAVVQFAERVALDRNTIFLSLFGPVYREYVKRMAGRIAHTSVTFGIGLFGMMALVNKLSDMERLLEPQLARIDRTLRVPGLNPDRESGRKAMLGDAILGIIVGQWLYARLHLGAPAAVYGDLFSELTSNQNLSGYLGPTGHDIGTRVETKLAEIFIATGGVKGLRDAEAYLLSSLRIAFSEAEERLRYAGANGHGLPEESNPLEALSDRQHEEFIYDLILRKLDNLSFTLNRAYTAINNDNDAIAEYHLSRLQVRLNASNDKLERAMRSIRETAENKWLKLHVSEAEPFLEVLVIKSHLWNTRLSTQGAGPGLLGEILRYRDHVQDWIIRFMQLKYQLRRAA